MTSDLDERRLKVEEAKKYLDSVLTDDDMHIVMVSMQDKTMVMAVHVINVEPAMATSMLQVAATYTVETDNEVLRRAH